jgi:hypothetical protein
MERAVDADVALAGLVALSDLANVQVRDRAAIGARSFAAGAVRAPFRRLRGLRLCRPVGRRPAVLAVFGVRVAPPAPKETPQDEGSDRSFRRSLDGQYSNQQSPEHRFEPDGVRLRFLHPRSYSW